MTEKETIDAEVAEEKKKEEGAFSSWWKKTKKAFSDEMLESNLYAHWKNTNPEWNAYPPDGKLFSTITAHGVFENGLFTYYTKETIPEGSIIIEKKTGKAYFVGASETVAIPLTYEGKEYIREGKKAALDPNATEVNVIKAGDRYFLKK